VSEPVSYVAKGYGTEPCPGCGENPTPGQRRTVVPGVWIPWHAVCFEAPRCACCGENHPDGSCLL
jgi:hypothetical protein